MNSNSNQSLLGTNGGFAATMSFNAAAAAMMKTRKGQAASGAADSLFSMALYDINHDISRKTPPSLPSSTAVAAPKFPTRFYPSEEYKDLTLREILDLSEECLFSDDEDDVVAPEAVASIVPPSHAALPVPVPSSSPAITSQLFPSKTSSALHIQTQPTFTTVAARPTQTKDVDDDDEWSELEEIPRDDTIGDISVAAALIESMDAPLQAETSSSSFSSTTINCKRRASSDLDDEGEGEDDGFNGADEDIDEMLMLVGGSDSKAEDDARFRPYQTGQWSEKFEELLEYRQKTGHCLVPHTYRQNLPLARWVKRQRYQYKLLKEGKTSTMTPDRVKALEDIGFVWDSQGAAWGERLSELKEYKAIFKHCNVPSNYSENPRLATWVKCQRRQYKLFTEGKPSNMTLQRINELNDLGFEWELRSYSKKQRMMMAANGLL